MKKLYLATLITVSSFSAFGQNNIFGTKDINYALERYKNIDESIALRQRQIYDLPNTSYGCYYPPDPYDHAKDWSNPKLSDSKVQDVIDEGLEIFKQTFSESLKSNPELLSKMEGKLAAIRSGGCDKQPNKCLVEIYATIETYGKFLKPDLGGDTTIWDLTNKCGKRPKSTSSKKFQSWSQCQLEVMNHNQMTYQRKFYLDSYNSIQEEQKINGTSFDMAAYQYFNENYESLKRDGGVRLNLANNKLGKINKGIQTLFLELEDEQKKIQNKMRIFWDKLVNAVNPQAGCAISGQRIAAFPMPEDLKTGGIPTFGFAQVENVDGSCYTEDKLLASDFIRTDFEAEETKLTDKTKVQLQDQLETIIKNKEDDGFTVTSVKVIGIASRSWATLKDDAAAKDKNLTLAALREETAKELIADFKNINISISTGHELAGPRYTQSKDLALKDKELNDQAIEQMYKTLTSDRGINHLYSVGINSLEEYKRFLNDTNEKAKEDSNDRGVQNLYDLKYRPFQGFKVVIKGHKSIQVPCDEYGKQVDKDTKKLTPTAIKN